MSTTDSNDVKSFSLSISGLVAAITVNAITMIAFFSAFVILRQFLPFVYTPKKETKVFSFSNVKSLHKSLFSFIPDMFTVTDDELVEVAGINGFAAFAFCRLAFKLFLGIALICLIVLLPINATGTAGKVDLEKFTMGNVSDEGRFTSHLIMSWFCNVFIIYGVFKILNLALQVRRDHLMSVLENSLGYRSILVRDIPSELLNETSLFHIFNAVGPVDKVFLVRQDEALTSLTNNANKLRKELEVSAMVLLRNILKNDPSSGKSTGDSSPHTVVLADEEGSDRLEKLRPRKQVHFFTDRTYDRIREALSKYSDIKENFEVKQEAVASKAPMNSAFIVFKKEASANLALSAGLIDNPMAMTERHLVIDQENIRWEPLGFSYFYRLIMNVAGITGVIALSIFWLVIVTLVTSLVQLDTLAKIFPFLSDLIRAYPAIGGFVGGYLAPLLVSVLLSLVPTLLRIVAKYQGAATIASIEKFVLNWQFFFLVFNVLIVVTISQSVLKTLQSIAESPLSAPGLFAQSVPPASKYFINYVMLLAFSGPPGALLQISQIFMRSIKVFGLLGTNTPRTMQAALQPAQWDFAAQMAQHSLVVAIGITYATLAPLVLIFVVLYFGFWSFAYLYLIQNVFEKGLQTGGTELYYVGTHLFVGVYISEITLLGLFSAQGKFIHTVFMVIQIVFTFVAQQYARKYKKVVLELPVQIALENEMKELEKRAKAKAGLSDEEEDKPPRSRKFVGALFKSLFSDVSGLASDVGKLGKGVTSEVAGVAFGLANASGATKILQKMKSDVTASDLEALDKSSSSSIAIESKMATETDVISVDEEEYEIFAPPSMRKNALTKVWLPNSDPLNAVEDVILPEYSKGGIGVLSVDASVDWKGKLELGNGMLENPEKNL
ncbi:hypothetical protein HK098_002933 [Nowakowskiella sp. JEL0407]|nr:hypothetical protein HK098_002933 [Nowakowskiella sp. JEL0407]